MKIETYTSEEAWKEGRRGRITGTKVGTLLSKRDKKPLKGYYELIAERLALPASQENVMDRGKRLEDEAVERFAKETGKKVKNELVIWSREDNPDIAISPDAAVGSTEAVEVKCLNSAAHIEALLTKHIPDEYEPQVLQYFVVNDKLKALHFVFYDPRMPKDFFYITVNRKEVQEKVKAVLEMQLEVLKMVADVEKQLTF